MTFLAEILSPKYSVVFAKCLDSELRLVLYVISGLSPGANACLFENPDASWIHNAHSLF
jgi:hypothetical protein